MDGDEERKVYIPTLSDHDLDVWDTAAEKLLPHHGVMAVWPGDILRATSELRELRAERAETERVKETIDEIWAALDVRYETHSWEEAESALQAVYIALAVYREGDAADPAPAAAGEGTVTP